MMICFRLSASMEQKFYAIGPWKLIQISFLTNMYDMQNISLSFRRKR